MEEPPPTLQHIESCALPTWYRPLRKVTIRSVIIPLPPFFLQYLQQDGIRLPLVPDNVVVSPNDPRKESESTWSSDEDEEEETNGDTKSNASSEAPEPPTHCFPALEAAIQAGIDQLGGQVFPKLDWSSPRDASFLKGGTMKCDNVGDIFLLLKGSDFISHDMNHAFDAAVGPARLPAPPTLPPPQIPRQM